MARIVIEDKKKKYIMQVKTIGVRTADIAKLYVVDGATVIKLYENKNQKRTR